MFPCFNYQACYTSITLLNEVSILVLYQSLQAHTIGFNIIVIRTELLYVPSFF